MFQKLMLAAFLVFLFSNANAATSAKFDLNFKNAPVVEVAEFLAKKMELNFIVDPDVQDSDVTLINSKPVDRKEAFDQFSSALALNSLAISVQDGSHIILPARKIQRSLIEVTTTLPKLKPERMVTYIYTFKNADAVEFNKQVRIMSSKDGEVYANAESNQLVLNDWTSNIHRIHQILVEHDRAAKK